MKRGIVVVAFFLIWIFTLLILPNMRIASAQMPSELTQSERDAIYKETIDILTSRVWEVMLTPESKMKKSRSRGRSSNKTDTLTFTRRKVTSMFLAKQGYSENGSNYSLHITDDGIVVWETVARDDKERPAFLRGEFHGPVMKGSIITKTKKGENIIHYFESEPYGNVEIDSASTEVASESNKD